MGSGVVEYRAGVPGAGPGRLAAWAGTRTRARLCRESAWEGGSRRRRRAGRRAKLPKARSRVERRRRSEDRHEPGNNLAPATDCAVHRLSVKDAPGDLRRTDVIAGAEGERLLILQALSASSAGDWQTRICPPTYPPIRWITSSQGTNGKRRRKAQELRSSRLTGAKLSPTNNHTTPLRRRADRNPCAPAHAMPDTGLRRLHLEQCSDHTRNTLALMS